MCVCVCVYKLPEMPAGSQITSNENVLLFKFTESKCEHRLIDIYSPFLLRQTLRRHQSVSQQNLELNIESLGKRQRLEKNIHS